MSIASLLRLLWRQRRVVIPAAVVALLACVGVLIVQPPVYRASAAVVLLNPPALPEVTPENPTIPPEYQNPYSRFGDLSVIVDILVKVLDSEPVQQQLKAQGLDGTFEIAANRDFYRGPIIDVAGEGPSGSAAITNTNLVIAELERQLTTLQTSQGTDPSYWIRVETIVTPDKATTVFSGTLRALILVGGLGVVLTVGAGLVADSRFVRDRRAAREVSPDPETDYDYDDDYDDGEYEDGEYEDGEYDDDDYDDDDYDESLPGRSSP
ncbi:MAG: hypothetical protein H6513_15885 [Acidimicrobiaceae bacterium]|nr:hypothetical protein [Ilumatobacter sp.]MCB9382165.1 hypothetical protein [Acidimicrobiaceae bacterium]MCO5330919.1 Wzz/FepE/Etk N-terminal domain-containing protein [Ilumatobacteraceae bacterium]